MVVHAGEGWSERQAAVLDAALALLVESGDKLTMTAVARRASCSKETLYKWFGDRDGLLTATVQHQAAQVRAAPIDPDRLDAETLAERLRSFAADWLRVISGPTSVALNRLAVGQAGTERHDLGRIVLDNGPAALRARLRPLLDLSRERGLLSVEDADEAFATFFGLVVRDSQIRSLLGDRPPAEAENERAAVRATRQFLALYGAVSQGSAKAPEPAS